MTHPLRKVSGPLLCLCDLAQLLRTRHHVPAMSKNYGLRLRSRAIPGLPHLGMAQIMRKGELYLRHLRSALRRRRTRHNVTVRSKI